MTITRLGKQGEAAVRDHLCSRGWQLLAENWRYGRLGELDLVMRDQAVLVFIEVKTRQNHNFGSPLEAIDLRKQAQLIKLAEAFLSEHPDHADLQVRFDVVTVEPDRTGSFEIVVYQNLIG